MNVKKSAILLIGLAIVAIVFVIAWDGQDCGAGEVSAKLTQIKKGETSEAEVKSILGPPVKEKEETKLKLSGRLEVKTKTLYYNDGSKEIQVVIDMATAKVSRVMEFGE